MPRGKPKAGVKIFTKIYVRTCDWCSEEFETTKSTTGKRYCSRSHYQAAFNAERRKPKEEWKEVNYLKVHEVPCKDCGRMTTTRSNFSAHGSNGVRCDSCKKLHETSEARRVRKRQWRYGLSEERYDELTTRQGRQCVGCGDTESLVVDHDHVTGVVRGLLCDGCNRTLGWFKDDPVLLMKAAEYLEAQHAN